MKYNPNTHIVGKVYDLTQENMNALLDEIDRLNQEYDAALMALNISNKENARYREALEFTLKAAESLYQPDKPVHKGLDPTFYHTLTYEGDMELVDKTKKAREALKEK